MSSTNRNCYHPESAKNSVLIYEETIPGSSASTSDEQIDQDETKKALQEHNEERKSDPATNDMNMIKYSNMLKK